MGENPNFDPRWNYHCEARVYHDPELSDGAKMLYMLIGNLAGKEGYCYASNKKLAEIRGIKEDTVSKQISQLQKAGYVINAVIRKATQEVQERRLYLNMPAIIDPQWNCPTLPDLNPIPLPDLNPIPPGFKSEENNINNNTNTPLTPQGGKGAKRVRTPKAPREAPDWKPDRFAGFWDYYPAKGRRNKQKAMDAWDKLKPDDALIDKIAVALKKLKATEEWQRDIGIPHASTFLNGARWEDAEELGAPEKPQESPPRKPGRWVYEVIDGEEVAFWEEEPT